MVELTDAGLDYYFLRPLELADAGFVVRQSASLGMMGAKNFMSPVLRSVIGRMEVLRGLLRIVAGFIRGLMDCPKDGKPRRFRAVVLSEARRLDASGGQRQAGTKDPSLRSG